MKKEKIGFFFVILANLILLLHTILPHHHHDSHICILGSKCNHHVEQFNDISSDFDHHDSKSSSCILKQLFFLPGFNNSQFHNIHFSDIEIFQIQNITVLPLLVYKVVYSQLKIPFPNIFITESGLSHRGPPQI